MFNEEIRSLLEQKRYILNYLEFQSIMNRDENPQVTHADYIPDPAMYNFNIHAGEESFKVKVKVFDWSGETI